MISEDIKFIFGFIVLMIAVLFLMFAKLTSRLNEVETQLSRIEKIGGLSDKRNI